MNDDLQCDVHQREAGFSRDWAAGTPLESIRVRECFEAPTAQENRFIIKHMGPLEGKSVLDLGAGLGESAVYLALRGAKVTILDISSGMVEVALQLARRHGVELEGIVSPVEDFEFPRGRFDIVYAANVIHHVTDRERLFDSIRHTLKPGGKFFSWDPLQYNPIINVYRRMADHNRTRDETPLNRSDLRMAERYFIGVRHREYWIAALALFLKYYFIDRVHPNEDRYWKRILRETDLTLWWWKPLKAIDTILTRVPGLRWMAWNMVLMGETPKLAAPLHGASGDATPVI